MNIEMKQWQLNITSQQETEILARKLSELAWAGMVIALDGDLGAGKTTFSKSFAAQLGVQGIVSSPTFTIIKEYEGSELPFYHMDVYRLSIEEADELGLDDYFYGQGVTIIEWASLITEIMPPQYVSLFIEYVDEEERLMTLKAYGERYISCIEKLIDGSTSQ
ncbi:MAG: tRNA (adenosine(37)-N6)-threonylcarbamoyltransferase complex ATPase subunit type 1 TsaE [Candidatus Pristimantibacillus lignocellulolyticus]|uniref:tRNA threonylcarbamoyladenosine biosynthesis protein TsaE n=1 Tax=Candidatus Pristimantibacillus lignocellulolyticus TaxID=2994561 RepID=A0A9J6ZKY7_9BACL|nr:MAG: tRNA (adenosine(37)-N6)-threonylcarbamoyltransferase complex ATPase subunit type 1 TsaE [Candidatus Pristimantibacillus lignocellulolyticus]